ncbi:hypothetical protein EMCRGX_G010092 [Ephydatia muelleri]
MRIADIPSQPLYSGAPITAQASWLSIYSEVEDVNVGCVKSVCKSTSTQICYFTLLSFESCLKGILEENWDKLLHSDQTTSVPGVIKDIHDGARYKDLKKEVEIDDAVEHIELILCTDGVPLFKSSGQSIWPVVLSITNLPQASRMNVSNLILAGIWLGPVKPTMDIILKPILEKLELYNKKGILITGSGWEKVIKPKLLMCVFDLVARPIACDNT